MPFRYTTTEYYFREPNLISEIEYLSLKEKIQNDSNFSLLDPDDTITKNYSKLFKFLIGACICAILLPIFWIMGENDKENWFIILGFAITMLWSIAGLLAFLMSATDLRTYANYLKNKRNYFTRMEVEIRKSKSYIDFLNNFYKYD